MGLAIDMSSVEYDLSNASEESIHENQLPDALPRVQSPKRGSVGERASRPSRGRTGRMPVPPFIRHNSLSIGHHCAMIQAMPRSAYSAILIALAASAASAGTVTVPAAPESPFDDTESVTNAAVCASLIQRARTFSGDIALYATPSNALEVAFGTSRSGDGILLSGDETFSIGWGDGAWFIASPTNRIATTGLVGAMRRSLSFSMRMSEEGIPTRLTLAFHGMIFLPCPSGHGCSSD